MLVLAFCFHVRALGITGGFYFFNFFCKNFYKVLAYVKSMLLVCIHIILTLWH